MSKTNWSNVESAAKAVVSNWRKFDSFAWHRASDLDDADQWAIFYTTGRDAGLLDQSNHAEITKLLDPFTEGDDPDLVFERHSHWAVGHVDGFSIRAYRRDRSITDAFIEFCRIKAKLVDYPILNEIDYSEREYQATLENYAAEMWADRELPEGWESEVHSWFCDHGEDRYIENRDDAGGYAPKEKIEKALRDLGLLPTLVIEAHHE